MADRRMRTVRPVGALTAVAVLLVGTAVYVNAQGRGRGAILGDQTPAPAARGAALPSYTCGLGPAGRTGIARGNGIGPNDLAPVDSAAADCGRAVWASECITCHGTTARGGEQGPNLVRSVMVLHDRHGSELGPFFKKGHKIQSGKPSASLTDAQVFEVAHFLRQKIDDTLRSSPLFNVQNILTGDKQAGAAYFNGAGTCATCHSPTGDFAGIGERFDAVTLQQRFLFPPAAASARSGVARGAGARGARGGAAAAPILTVTVTPPKGPAITGLPIQIDPFFVTLRDNAGNLHVLKRVPGMTVVETNRLSFHVQLLDRITDKQMHDVVAYLESLK